MRWVFSTVVLALSFTALQSLEIPDVLKLCDREDPGLDECLKVNIQSAIKDLSRGVPELKLRALDPYLEKEMVIEYKQNQIGGKAILNNIKAHGLSKAKVHAVRSNIQDDSFELEIDMSNKEIVIEGYLKGEGRLNALVFTSKGYFNNTMSDIVWTWKLTGKPQVKKGKTYMKIVKFFMRPEVGNMRVHIPNVFGNNPDLNRIAYDFSNNNWRIIYRELLPIVELTWEKIGTGYVNRIFSKIPYNELFPSRS